MEPQHKNAGNEKAASAASLSRTMPIALEEQDPDRGTVGMSLTIRGKHNTPPRNVPIERKAYTIGRQEGVDILIPSPSVSRRHARMFFLHEEEILEDLNSTNGTFVNGVRVTRCVLQDNDIIRIGDATMLFSRTPGTRGNAHEDQA